MLYEDIHSTMSVLHATEGFVLDVQKFRFKFVHSLPSGQHKIVPSSECSCQFVADDNGYEC